MNTKEVLEFLGISRGTLVNRIKDGTITPLPPPSSSKVLKKRGRLEFNRVDIERLRGD